MSIAEQAHELMALAKSRDAADRERLMLALVDLCDEDEDVRSPAVQSLIESIFMNLVVEAERDIRRLLAEKLASAPWAPPALVNVPALDEIEIARPVIALSPVLRDQDLIRLLVEATIEHQIEVARRPSLGPPVVEAILGQDEPAVLTALAGNDTAEISIEGMAKLLEASRRIAAMRSPLVRHPKLTSEMAQRLYLWVGQSLRAAIVTRFRVDPAALDQAMADAVRHAHGQVQPATRAAGAAFETDPDHEEMEHRLIAKLHAAGQLKSSYLLRVLRERKLSLFRIALSTLGGYSIEDVRRAMNSDRPELLALACVSVGMDRSVFPTVLSLVRDLNGGRPTGGVEAGRRAARAFSVREPGQASTAFRHALTAVG